jgi:hypothetical protein
MEDWKGIRYESRGKLAVRKILQQMARFAVGILNGPFDGFN